MSMLETLMNRYYEISIILTPVVAVLFQRLVVPLLARFSDSVTKTLIRLFQRGNVASVVPCQPQLNESNTKQPERRCGKMRKRRGKFKKRRGFKKGRKRGGKRLGRKHSPQMASRGGVRM